MSARITDTHLQALVDNINFLSGMEKEPYTDGNPNAGTYLLSYEYGGVNLHRMSLTEGRTSETCPLTSGVVTKRELYGQMQAYIRGLEASKEGK